MMIIATIKIKKNDDWMKFDKKNNLRINSNVVNVDKQIMISIKNSNEIRIQYLRGVSLVGGCAFG